MPPLPKKKHSRHRKRSRASHFAKRAPSLVTCSSCGEPNLPHRACPDCGYFNGRPVVAVGRTELE
jgi:large subunit ribosomal protein L32